ncbi:MULTISPECIES: hypothetical protein [Psychrobacter]|nr:MULTISPECIES: hypothetical protein [Psychrobacter]
MAAWVAADIQQRLNTATKTATAPTIAILAPKWAYFDAIQHYL